MKMVAESLQGEGHVDPDAQATVTDFLDYTEYLPADLIRSLTLIGKLDESYLSSTTRIHKLLSDYGGLPHSTASKKQNPQLLRKEISYYLEHALNARESAYAESSRLYDEVERHYNRLASVKSKLLALPKPPSRDPTPVPIQHSPQANRARLGRIEEGGDTPPPRITLRLNANGSRHHGGSHRPRHRIRRITVPGEVLPPPNPDSPPSMTDTDWESRSPSPVPMPTSRVGAPPRSRSIKPNHVKLPKPPKPPRIKVPKTPRPPRPPRPPGAMGTNVHSAVAGISTSNALSLLTPPPPDAKPGTVHAPWMRLTEWEMARLRKRMKKNAIWTPSETMIRRELSEAGRGPENYRKTRSRCEETGDEFLDCDNIATTAPGKQLVPGEISADSLGFESKLSNKGMKLNEAKKLKKELLAREQAANAAAEAEQAAKRLGDIGSSFKNLFDKPGAAPLSAASSSGYLPLYGLEKPAAKPPKKRKLAPTLSTEESQLQAQLHAEIVLSPNKPVLKKRKTAPPPPVPVIPLATATTTTTTVPLAAPAPSPIKNAPPPASSTVVKKALPAAVAATTSAASRSRRPSLTLRGPAPPPEPTPTSRPPSRPSSRHVSTGPIPPSPQSREHLRRKSATPAPAPSSTTTSTAASRRSKRPAPGPVTNSHDGGAAVSVGRRKNAPRKRGARRAAEGSAKEREEEKASSLEEEAPEEIDPDEPRYCLCGDVSFGTMICCENPDCEKEWFHLECVGLLEPPGRRVKWYCPDCRVKAGRK